MTNNKSRATWWTLLALIVATGFLIVGTPDSATAQRGLANGSIATLDAGTVIPVRTTETIVANRNGQVFSGVIDEDVVNRNGILAIPRGSEVELALRDTSNNGVALGLDTVTINGQQYRLETEASRTRTLARGRRVPAQSLLAFRLVQPLRLKVADNDYSPAYRAGLRTGRADADRSLRRNTQSTSWSTTPQQRRDYEAGYNQGYDSVLENNQSYSPAVDDSSQAYDRGSVSIGRDNNVSWQAPENARVYVQVDNEPFKLFAEGPSGVQSAPWIESGHRYLFVLEDLNGNEIARHLLDLRHLNRGRSR